MNMICNLHKEEYKTKLIATLNEISDTVSSTLGPNGKTCILYNGNEIPHVTKDGVTVAEFIHFKDHFQEAINKIIKETARKTGEKVGDGTTTSILLACELTKQILNKEGDIKTNLNEVESSIQEVIKNIQKDTVTLDIFNDNTIDILQSIVHLSSNGDSEITDIIIDTLNTIGADGIIDVVLSNNELTFVDTHEGILIEAPAHIIKTFNVDNPLVTLVSSRIEKVHEIKSCMELSLSVYQKSKRSVIIIAKEFSKEVQDIVTINNINNKFSMFLVESDGFAFNMFEILDDMASLLDCKILSTDNSSPFGLQNIEISHFSTKVKSAVISPNQTILQGDNFITSENVNTKNNLSKELNKLKNSGENKLNEIANLKKRLNKFTKSATIFVGGFTDAEKAEKKDRVDDAVKALESAINGGVIAGGGYSLFKASEKVKSDIVKDVCRIPAKLLSQNIDINIFDVFKLKKVMDFNTKKIGEAFDLGILDPAKVSVKALQQAMVIVRLLLNTHSIIIPDINEI